MEFNLNIQKLGKTSDVFGFFDYLINEIDSENYCLLESVAEQSHEMLFSFIGAQPDFMIKTVGKDLS